MPGQRIGPELSCPIARIRKSDSRIFPDGEAAFLAMHVDLNAPGRAPVRCEPKLEPNRLVVGQFKAASFR